MAKRAMVNGYSKDCTSHSRHSNWCYKLHKNVEGDDWGCPVYDESEEKKNEKAKNIILAINSGPTAQPLWEIPEEGYLY